MSSISPRLRGQTGDTVAGASSAPPGHKEYYYRYYYNNYYQGIAVNLIRLVRFVDGGIAVVIGRQCMNRGLFLMNGIVRESEGRRVLRLYGDRCQHDGTGHGSGTGGFENPRQVIQTTHIHFFSQWATEFFSKLWRLTSLYSASSSPSIPLLIVNY